MDECAERRDVVQVCPSEGLSFRTPLRQTLGCVVIFCHARAPCACVAAVAVVLLTLRMLRPQQRGCEAGCPRRRLFSESEAGKRGETGAQPGAAHLAASQHCIEDAVEPSAQKVRINLMFGAIQKN